MIINYKFANGDESTVEIEVNKEIEKFIEFSNRYEHRVAEKERYHCYSLEQGVEEGFQYADESNIEALFQEPSQEERLHTAMNKLKPKQRELIKAIYFDGVSVNEYAISKGVVQSAISHQLERAKKILKKFL
jgi:RNA polymerase sigma factor (sigma-70 family)